MSLAQTPLVLGNARFTVHAPGLVRLEYARDARFSPYPSILAGPKPARPVAAEAARTAKSLSIRTERFTLAYRDDGRPFHPGNLSITHRDHWNEEQVWVPGKRDRGNLGSVVRSLDYWTHCGGPERYPVEGILSTDGGHYLADEGRVYWNARAGWPEARHHFVQSDGYFFAYGNDFKQALRDFIAVFGRIPMVPRWTFGFWYSRYYAYTEKEFLGLARDYRKRGIPLDVMIIDTDWRKAVWGGYDWNKKYFPNPRRALKALHAMGLKTSLNDHPGYDHYDNLPDGDSRIPSIARRLGVLPHQGSWACDWSRKEAVQAWKDLLLAPFFKEGMDFWWVDGWCKPSFGVYPMGGILHGGNDSQGWLNRHYYELSREKTGKRGMILSRWGGVGSHRYPVQFSGDTFSEWGMLKEQIPFTARSGNLGCVYWSHDIGGFLGRRIDEELYIRWFQFGSLSPVFRTHSDHGDREPWKYGPRVETIFRKQARMRTALAPFFYTLAREAHESGLPICRPLYIEYNDNNGAALNQKGQYLLGRDILVVPADGPADAATGVFRKRAYLPPGRWHELEGPASILGPHDHVLSIPLEVIPTFAREGAIIPCQPVGRNVGTSPVGAIEFDVFPAESESSFTLYEDDGESLECEKGRFARTTVSARRRGGAIEVRIGKPRGDYRGRPRKRKVTILVRLEPGERPARALAWRGVKERNARRIPCGVTNRILCGELESGHLFAKVTAPLADDGITVRIEIASARG